MGSADQGRTPPARALLQEVDLNLLRSLRSTRLITAELALVTLAVGAFTVLPQVTEDPDKARRFAESLGRFGPPIRYLQLDHILGAWWFLLLLLLSGASLAVVVVEQWKRTRSAWKENPAPAAFRSSPFQRAWAVGSVGSSRVPGTTIRTSGRVGLLGLPLFHTGLLLILLAGFLRMLLGADAVVDLYAGETLPPTPAAYGAQWPGRLARPFVLDTPLTFHSLAPSMYPDGTIKGLSARLDLGGSPADLAVNAPLRLGSRSLYLTQSFGPAAFLDVEAGGIRQRSVLFLKEAERGAHRATAFIGGLEVRLGGRLGNDGSLPIDLDCRVLGHGGLLAAGRLGPGQALSLPSGGRIALFDLRPWAQFRGSRDAALPLAYAGFALAILGAVLLFAVVRVDTAVVVEIEGGATRVWVALRARRFAPLYRERFERLVAENGGPPETGA